MQLNHHILMDLDRIQKGYLKPEGIFVVTVIFSLLVMYASYLYFVSQLQMYPFVFYSASAEL